MQTAPMVVNEVIASEIRAAIGVACEGFFESIETEIQDGGQFLLVSASCSEPLTDREIERIRDIVSGIMNRRVPPRLDEYSWMVNFMKHDRIIDSISGGWNRG